MSASAIDSALSGVKKTFLPHKYTPGWRGFPSSRRNLLTRIKRLTPFWHIVSHTTRIDLSVFNLSSGTRSVEFKFIDPLWGWVMAAQRLHPLDLHWKPIAQNQQSPVYGGGIQYGQCFLQACRSVPQGSYPMCVTLHWDGTHGRGLQCVPICIGVANTNSSGSETQFCLGYMPHVPDEKSPEYRLLKSSTTVKHYIRQQCSAAILRVLEAAAAGGVRCRLSNACDVKVERLLFPRLVSMNFDQPEAQLYFGVQPHKKVTRLNASITWQTTRVHLFEERQERS